MSRPLAEPVPRLKVCAVADLPPGDARVVPVNEKEVAVFNVGGAFHAMDNACPHRGAPLSDGRLEGKTVTCPWHGWRFDVSTGSLVVNPKTRQTTYPVAVRDGCVYLSSKADA